MINTAIFLLTFTYRITKGSNTKYSLCCLFTHPSDFETSRMEFMINEKRNLYKDRKAIHFFKGMKRTTTLQITGKAQYVSLGSLKGPEATFFLN